MTGDAQARDDEREDGRGAERRAESDESERADRVRDDDRDPGSDDDRERADSGRTDYEQDDAERRRTPTSMSEPTTDADRRRDSSTDSALRTNLYRGALGLFGLLAAVAVIQLYGSVNATIDTFVASEYRSLFRAAFNLVVLLVSATGISWCVRALSGE